MKNLIFIVPFFLVICDTVNSLNIIPVSMEWQVYFISEKLATIIILLAAYFNTKGRVRNGFILMLLIYSFEAFNEIIGENVKGTTLSELYYYTLLASTLYIGYYYIKYKWIIKL